MQASAGTALVTGGARRIGAAIVSDLAANGFDVAIHCNTSRKEANALAASISAAGGKMTAVVQADLTDRDALGSLIGKASQALGKPIDLLVNSASVFEDDQASDFSWDRWDKHFALHVDAPAMLARCLAEALPAGRNGLVVNVIDQRVLKPTPQFFSYTLSKTALWAATRTMAQALAPRVRVNAIGPGPTLPNSRQSDDDFRRQVDGILLRRGPELAEFGRTIRYLWETMSVTGQLITIDGGQHLAWETPDVTGMRE